MFLQELPPPPFSMHDVLCVRGILCAARHLRPHNVQHLLALLLCAALLLVARFLRAPHPTKARREERVE